MSGTLLVIIRIMVFNINLLIINLDALIQKILPVDPWDEEMEQEQIDDLWNNYGERDVNKFYGMENESNFCKYSV